MLNIALNERFRRRARVRPGRNSACETGERKNYYKTISGQAQEIQHRSHPNLSLGNGSGLPVRKKAAKDHRFGRLLTSGLPLRISLLRFWR